MTNLPPPTRTARLVVGVVASLAMLTGAVVLTVVAFVALYVGTPAWWVAAGVVAVLIGLAVAFQRVRRAAVRP